MERVIMLPMTPKELSGKIKYWNNDIYVKEGIKLTSEEEIIFKKYRNSLMEAQEDRFK